MHSTSLRGSSGFKKNTPLKTKTPLKAKTSLQARSELKSFTPLSCKQKSANKTGKAYFSVLTKNMGVCAISGEKEHVVPHHIFDGPNKALSESYGFMLPLTNYWHTLGEYSIHHNRDLDLKYKRMCQDYYVSVLGKTKEDFISEFGKWW